MKAVQASVGGMKSTDKTVHLKTVSGTNDGEAALNDRGFAIAAAAKSAGKKVWLTYTGFTPASGTEKVIGTFIGAEVGTDDWTD